MRGAPVGDRGAWTLGAFLPGGDLSGWIGAAQRPDTDIVRFTQTLSQRHPELPPALAARLVRGYGARVEALLQHGLGAEVVPGLFEAELKYLHDHEWARSADDVLWRRSKLGLHLSPAQRAAVAAWCAAHWPDAIATPDRTAAPAAKSPETTWN